MENRDKETLRGEILTAGRKMLEADERGDDDACIRWEARLCRAENEWLDKDYGDLPDYRLYHYEMKKAKAK